MTTSSALKQDGWRELDISPDHIILAKGNRRILYNVDRDEIILEFKIKKNRMVEIINKRAK